MLAFVGLPAKIIASVDTLPAAPCSCLTVLTSAISVQEVPLNSSTFATLAVSVCPEANIEAVCVPKKGAIPLPVFKSPVSVQLVPSKA